MLKNIKNIFTLEPPLGEAWLIVGATLILGISGIITPTQSLSWILPALLFVSILISGYLLQKLWQRRRTGVFWYIYTIVVIVSFFAYVPFLSRMIMSSDWLVIDVWFFLLSIFSTLFITMILLGKEIFTKNFWKVFFVIEIASLLVEINHEALRQSLNTPMTALTSVLYILFLAPYLIKLFRYSFLNK